MMTFGVFILLMDFLVLGSQHKFTSRSSLIKHAMRQSLKQSIPTLEHTIIDFVNHQSKIQNLINMTCPGNHCHLDNQNIETLQGITLPIRKYTDYIRISLNNNHLRNLRGLRSKANITQINLSGNKINEFKNLDINLDQLTHLTLDNNGITSEMLRTTFDFTSMPRLESLSLKNNNITSLNGIHFPSLHTLDLSGNPISSFESVNIFSVEIILRYIDITDEMLQNQWHKDIEVRILDLSHNKIHNLSSIRFPVDLEILNLNGNDIQNYKYHTFPLELRYLYLNNTGINDELLRQITFPPHLSTLVLTHNEIKSIANIRFPSHLESLNLGYNNIQVIRDITFPTQLRYLCLSHNKLSNNRNNRMNVKFPETLHALRLSHNYIHSLSGMMLPGNLRSLYLDSNGITNRMLFFIALKLPKHLLTVSLRHNNVTGSFASKLFAQTGGYKWILTGNNIDNTNPRVSTRYSDGELIYGAWMRSLLAPLSPTSYYVS